MATGEVARAAALIALMLIEPFRLLNELGTRAMNAVQFAEVCESSGVAGLEL